MLGYCGGAFRGWQRVESATGRRAPYATAHKTELYVPRISRAPRAEPDSIAGLSWNSRAGMVALSRTGRPRPKMPESSRTGKRLD